MLMVIKNFFKLLSKISSITISDDDIHIKFKGNLLIESNNLFLYSKDGVLVTKHKVTHFNPIILNKDDLDLNDAEMLAYQTKLIHQKQDRLNKIMLRNLSLRKNSCRHNEVKNKRTIRYTE